MKFSDEALAQFSKFVGARIGKGCRLWRGYLDKNGYGRIRLGGKRYRAHVAAAIIQLGYTPPEGYQACHKCDNPWCVEGTHIFYGTGKENHWDAVNKGRKKRISRIRRKISPDMVLGIRRAEGSCIKVGLIFGVSPMMVSKIKRGIAWGNIRPDGSDSEEDD